MGYLWLKSSYGGVVENWTPVLKQLLFASTCLVKGWKISLYTNSTCKASIKLRFLMSQFIQINSKLIIYLGWVSKIYLDRISSGNLQSLYPIKGSHLSMQREPQQERNLYCLRLKILNLLRVVHAHMRQILTALIDTKSTPLVNKCIIIAKFCYNNNSNIK